MVWAAWAGMGILCSGARSIDHLEPPRYPRSMTAPELPAGLSDLASAYDVLLCDVWGVIHNGRESFPVACAAVAGGARAGAGLADRAGARLDALRRPGRRALRPRPGPVRLGDRPLRRRKRRAGRLPRPLRRRRGPRPGDDLRQS